MITVKEFIKILIGHVLFFIVIIALFFLSKVFVEYFDFDTKWMPGFAISFVFLAYGVIGLVDYYRFRDKSTLEPIFGAIFFFILCLSISLS